MKQAKASVKEAETLLRWLQKMENAGHRPPPYSRTVHGYLLLLEHCADPEKDYLDFKPGTSPAEISALIAERDALRKSLRDLSCAVHRAQDWSGTRIGDALDDAESKLAYDRPAEPTEKVKPKTCGECAKQNTTCPIPPILSSSNLTALPCFQPREEGGKK